MTIGELIDSSGYEMSVTVLFEVELYGNEIQLTFSSGNLFNTKHIRDCKVSDWKPVGERKIKIWSVDDLVWKVTHS